LLGLVGSAVIGIATNAAELSSIALVDDTAVIALNGDISVGNTDAIETLMRTVNEGGRLVSALRLDSNGGSLVEAIRLADLVRRAKLPTIVAAGARCASACFIVFAAGVEKFASYDAQIGVHGVSDKFGRETEQTDAATIAMARIVSRFGVPPSIIGQMVTTPAQEIAWLTPQDLREMGVVVTGQRQHLAPLPSPGHRELAGLDLPVDDIAVRPEPLTPDDHRHAEANKALMRGDHADAIRHWRQLAESGDGISQYNMAKMYAAGRGVARDAAAAAEWYRRAAESGVAHARLCLGIAYALGRGVPQDLLQAHKWLDLAAEVSDGEDRNRAVALRDLVASKMNPGEIADAQRLTREWRIQRALGQIRQGGKECEPDLPTMDAAISLSARRAADSPATPPSRDGRCVP
jgi:hypothetical protein